ncbi:hypothetical protein BDV33DRAFT_167775 [Aspergillus novoparasiticus]|uniref:Uncharacterized protein n=1 Tax=Aspergillus novoparasiticus TaxID=986946 RepID=A0A5N6F1D9_9EURO|nr:hypothetical protein BDV33DRAFT_167775 [Aspergillus novoparasiticus]
MSYKTKLHRRKNILTSPLHTPTLKEQASKHYSARRKSPEAKKYVQKVSQEVKDKALIITIIHARISTQLLSPKKISNKEGENTALHPILTGAARRWIEGRVTGSSLLRHGSCLEDCWIGVRGDAFSACSRCKSRSCSCRSSSCSCRETWLWRDWYELVSSK